LLRANGFFSSTLPFELSLSKPCPRESVGLASTPLTPGFYSQALGFRLVDSCLRRNDEDGEFAWL